MSRFTEPTAAINMEVADVIRRLDERQVDALLYYRSTDWGHPDRLRLASLYSSPNDG
jgi:hypothetical protein